jgi:hypothetical protein
LLAIPTVKFCVSARHSLASGTAVCPLASYLGDEEKQYLCITAIMRLHYCKHKLNKD